MTQKRKGGIITFNSGGVQFDAKGAFTYNLGRNKKAAVEGADKIHGYSEKPQVAFIEGAITDDADLDLEALVQQVDSTVTMKLANGKTVVLQDAWYAGEGTGNTEEGEIGVRFESEIGDEVPA